MSVFVLCVFCDSFLCSISLLLLSTFLSCILNSVLYINMIVHGKHFMTSVIEVGMEHTL